MDIVKEIAPYLVSIITAFLAYIGANKKSKADLKIVQENNQHEIDKLMKQHDVDIENIKEKHKLEMEMKDKEQRFEIEKMEQKTKLSLMEKADDFKNDFVSKILSEGPGKDLINDVLNGNMEKVNKLKELSNKINN